MTKLFAAVLIMVLIAGLAYGGEPLWYALEPGSMLDTADGISIELSGRIAIDNCGTDRQINIIDNKAVSYLIYAFKYDNIPDALKPQFHSFRDKIPLFGGPGINVGQKKLGWFKSDFTMSPFHWLLREQLEKETENAAVVYSRSLTLGNNKENSVTFTNSQQACPDSIILHLIVMDTWATYSPEQMTGEDGSQITAAVKKESVSNTVGQLTIVATAILDSLGEQYRDPDYEPKIRVNRQTDPDRRIGSAFNRPIIRTQPKNLPPPPPIPITIDNNPLDHMHKPKLQRQQIKEIQSDGE